MRYFYIHPFRPQYFFPKGFKKYDLFLNFFKPYSFYGKISWFLFTKIAFYRALFITNNIDRNIPEASIRKIVGTEPLMAFNKGTVGPEQKITALAIKNKNEFFIKYGQTDIAKENIANEHFILKQISHLEFVPKVLDFFDDEHNTLLMTNVLKGNRLSKTSLDERLINKLNTIARQEVGYIKFTKSSLKTAFAHGDFCPWNIMIKDDNILIYDWEMAGNYILGYDLFTFIFQTNFLLKPKMKISKIIKDNLYFIKEYFLGFNIVYWEDYLRAFTDYKLSLVLLKDNHELMMCYKKLSDYVSKI